MSESMGTEDSWLLRCGGVLFSLVCHLYNMILAVMLLRQTLQVIPGILPTFTTGILLHYCLRKKVKEIENLATFDNSNIYLEFLCLLHVHVFWEHFVGIHFEHAKYTYFQLV